MPLARLIGKSGLIVRLTFMLLLLAVALSASSTNPFAWLQSAVTIDAEARSRLERGEVIVRVLPAVDAEIGIFAAVRIDADPETLVVWANSIDQFKKSPYVLAVRRFSDPPALEDLDGLTLGPSDLEDARRCRPGRCDLKLFAPEIESVRSSVAAGGSQWKDAVQAQFRTLVFNRVLAYQAERITPDAAESFFYWSKEQYAAGKPVVSVTHVRIERSQEPGAVRVAMISREIMATHYRNASLGITAVTEDAFGQRYLAYMNQSQLDVLGGLFGGWKRAILEGRLKNESASVLKDVRRRLESGPPPE